MGNDETNRSWECHDTLSEDVEMAARYHLNQIPESVSTEQILWIMLDMRIENVRGTVDDMRETRMDYLTELHDFYTDVVQALEEEIEETKEVKDG